MKIKRVLFFCSAVFLLGCVILPDAVYCSVQKVDTVTARAASIEITATAAGVITARGEINQTASDGFVVGKICVLEGEYVRRGDKIIEIDRENTKKMYLCGASPDFAAASRVKRFIRATAHGTISGITAARGMKIKAGEPLYSLISPDAYGAIINIREDCIAKVRLSQPVSITGSGFDGRRYRGRITGIAAKVDAQKNNTVSATVSIDNPDRYLKAGFSIKARISTGTLNDAVTLPLNAVTQDEQGNEYVYVYKNKRARRTYVSTGFCSDEITEIRSGVDEGECVVAEPVKLNGKTVSVIARVK